MKKILTILALLGLSGCVQVDKYSEVVKSPAPANLAGYWQSQGPQSELVSPQAIASLIVTPEGDTLDCRQWQRVIALPGKLMVRDGDWYNVTVKREVYSAKVNADTLEYAGMTLKRVERPTAECADWLDKHPLQAVQAAATANSAAGGSAGVASDGRTPVEGALNPGVATQAP
ncbi:lipoprotein [Enterobacteriaceae bacterium 4M9]|nr:lipoprotein [Enterobacteriaceae bacterium 4M9]